MSTPADQSTVMDRVLSQVNGERARQGTPPLQRSPELCWAAMDHSLAMVQQDFFGWDGPDGVGLEARIRRTGYPGVTGGNLCHGHDTPEEAVAAWLGDPGTRQSLLNPEYQHLGVGVSASRWTILLGVPPRERRARGMAQPAAASPTPPAPRPPVSSPAPPDPVATAAGDGAAGAGVPRDPGLSAQLKFRTQQTMEEVWERLNALRQQAGAPALRLLPALNDAAQAQAVDMVARGEWDAADPRGAGCAVHAARAGFDGRCEALVAVGSKSSKEIIERWQGEGAAQAHLVDPIFTSLGVGLEASRWVVLLGGPPQDLPALLNAERQRAGRRPLAPSAPLSQVARDCARDMAQRSYLGERTPEGTPLAELARQAGFPGRVAVITLGGKKGPGEVLAALLQDEAHRQTALDPALCHLGDGESGGRWVLLFGAEPAAR